MPLPLQNRFRKVYYNGLWSSLQYYASESATAERIARE